jgi:hypothetical protein
MVAPSGHGAWTESDIGRAWDTAAAIWPEDAARPCEVVALAIAAGLSPAELLERLAAREAHR